MIDQIGAKCLFKIAQLLADGGLAEPGCPGRFRHRASRGKGFKHFKTAQCHAFHQHIVPCLDLIFVKLALFAIKGQSAEYWTPTHSNAPPKTGDHPLSVAF